MIKLNHELLVWSKRRFTASKSIVDFIRCKQIFNIQPSRAQPDWAYEFPDRRGQDFKSSLELNFFENCNKEKKLNATS